MNLPELSVKRHVLAYMLSGVLVLFGLISFQRIGVDRYPNIDFPMISITTALPGGDPEIVNSSITKVIESAVNSVPGIEHVESTSASGVSLISVRFAMEKDLGAAFNEVQAKVNQVLNRLPREAKPPIVAKVEIGATPIIWLALQGDRTPQQLNQYARNVIKKRLETINGVGEVRLGGDRERTLRVSLDPERMAGQGITIQDVTRAFDAEHVRLPGGFLVGGKHEDLIKLDLEFHSAPELEKLIVAYRGGAPIRLADIATVEDGLADNRQLARYMGKPAVGIGVVKVSGSNAVAVANEVERRLEREIIPQLPAGMTLSVASNDASLIREIVAALEEHLLTGTLFTALVVWLFLLNLRSTLIVAMAIPVSLLGAVAVMYFAGFTFNTMTLLGLLLLIGVVVDDAIVVLENIYRHRVPRLRPRKRSLEWHTGSRVCGDGRLADTGGDICSGYLHGRHHRAFLSGICRGRQCGGAGFAVRRPDSDTHAVRATPAGDTIHRSCLQLSGAWLSCHGYGLSRFVGPRLAFPVDGGRHHRGGRGWQRLVLRTPRRGFHAGTGRGTFSGELQDAPRNRYRVCRCTCARY